MQTGESSNSARGQRNLLGGDLGGKKIFGNEFIFHHLPWAHCLAEFFGHD